MRVRVRAALVLGICLAVGEGSATAAPPPTPPEQATVDYGSTATYVSRGARRYFIGNPFDPGAGDWCWYYLPRTLKHGDRAPVVVLLHGFALLAPDIYDRHIEHLGNQGVIVVYPQINKGGILGLLSDFDQNQMLDRAVDATRRCLARIGSRAAPGQTYLYGHSLGGLLAAVWASHPRAPAVAGMVLANPATDSFAGMPVFVADLIGDLLVPIDYVLRAEATQVPVVILTGDLDDVAPSAQSLELRDALVNAPSVTVYQAQSDFHAGEGLSADHMAPINNGGFLPDFLLDLFGGSARTNAIDYRFYWAALDAVLDGRVSLDFYMGNWSDGTAALPVQPL